MISTPISIVADGILTNSIYRFARFGRRQDLYTTTQSDDFFEVECDSLETRTGYIGGCHRSADNEGDVLQIGQWLTLQSWHVGLSCLLALRHPHTVTLWDEVNDELKLLLELGHASSIIEMNAMSKKVKFRQLLCYQLLRGTEIPDEVGIE